MNKNRRDFLRLFSVAALSAIAPLPSIGSIDGKRYSSDIFGLSIEYPFHWFHLLAADRIASFREVYGSDYQTFRVPIFQVTELQEPTNEVNPNFEIWADNHEEWLGTDIEIAARNYMATGGEYLDNFRMTSEVCGSVLCGRPAARCNFKFTENILAGKTLEYSVESHFIFHKEHFLMLAFKGTDADFNRLSSEFSAIRASLCLAR